MDEDTIRERAFNDGWASAIGEAEANVRQLLEQVVKDMALVTADRPLIPEDVAIEFGSRLTDVWKRLRLPPGTR